VTSQNTFPQLVEVIFGKLKVTIFHHDIKDEQEIISCWSYVTKGLAAQHQKEIIFTLRRDPNQKPEEYPRGVLDLFAKFFDLAEHGQFVDIDVLPTFPGDLGPIRRCVP